MASRLGIGGGCLVAGIGVATIAMFTKDHEIGVLAKSLVVGGTFFMMSGGDNEGMDSATPSCWFERHSAVLTVASCGVLLCLLGMTALWPRKLYLLLRALVASCAVLLIIQAGMRDRTWWAVVFTAIAVIFAPFVGWRFPRDAWEAIDIVTMLVMAFAMVGLRPRATCPRKV